MTDTQWLLCCTSSQVHYLKEVVPWKLSSARSTFLYIHPTREDQRPPSPTPGPDPPYPSRYDTMSPASDSTCQREETAQRPPRGGTDADFHVERLCPSRLQEPWLALSSCCASTQHSVSQHACQWHTVITHADKSRGSIAFIPVCLYVCVCLSVR